MLKKSNTVLAVTLALTLPQVANANPFKDKNKLGDLFMVMPTAYAVGMGIAYKDYKGLLQLTESVALGQIASEGIKALELEERPNHSDKKSFPSGHAAGAFSGAMYVHKRYGWKPALIPYGMSLITSWSRTAVKAHYWHDVLGGAALSALLTWVLVGKYEPKGIEVDMNSDGTRVGFKTEF